MWGSDTARVGGGAVARTTGGQPRHLLRRFDMIALITSAALSAPAADKVTSLPGFNFTDIGFDVYSGYLTVPGPFELTEYDSLSIHYQFHTCSRRQPRIHS